MQNLSLGDPSRVTYMQATKLFVSPSPPLYPSTYWHQSRENYIQGRASICNISRTTSSDNTANVCFGLL